MRGKVHSRTGACLVASAREQTGRPWKRAGAALSDGSVNRAACIDAQVNASPSLSATTPGDLAMKTAVISDTMDVVVRDLRLLPTKGRQAARGGVAGGKWAAHVCHPSDVTAAPGNPLGGFESLIDESRGFGCGFWSPPSSSESVASPADA